jgi:prepilin-type N-terminal cleavage/methylation domain-containing protein
MKKFRFAVRAKGFTLVELLIVVTIFGILLGLALPNLMKARVRARQQLCIENLSQIESAKQIWGVEQGKTDGDVPGPTDLVGANLYIKKTPICPAGGSYEYQAIGTIATCTIEGHSF